MYGRTDAAGKSTFVLVLRTYRCNPVLFHKKRSKERSEVAMSDGVVRFVGCIDMIVFFVSDFFFAYVLHQLKKDHPVIDDCAPDQGTREVDTIAVLSFMNNPTGATRGGDDDDLDSGRGGGRSGGASSIQSREDVIHKLVVVASFSAPIFSFLQVVSPTTLAWSQFAVPVWLGYLTMVPGLGVVMFYASRATRVSHFEEVSKAQWLSMMWFRLDIICVMATIFLLGWGDWLVAACLYAVALYLAHRLMITEKKLVSVTSKTQLVRDEFSARVDVDAGRAADSSPPSMKGYDSINNAPGKK